MGKPRRKIAAQAEETTTPPTALAASQSIARVDKAQGNNLFTCSLPDGKTILVELETRLRNTIWIISGCYVLIDTKEADARDNKIDGEIVNVVRDERSWRKAPFWPVEFPKDSAFHGLLEDQEPSIVGTMPPSDDYED